MSCRADCYASIPSGFYLPSPIDGCYSVTKAQEDGGVVDPFLGICSCKSLF